MHLADAFIQSDLQYIQVIHFSSVHVFPGNRTHNHLRFWRNALPLSHTGLIDMILIISIIIIAIIFVFYIYLNL